MAQNWNINPETRDYVMSGGSPENTDSLKVPAYIRLKTKRLSWLYAPDTNYGADFYLIKKKRTGEIRYQLESIASKALQPMADDGRVNAIDVTFTGEARHGISFDLNITDSGGRGEQVEINSLGV